MPDGPAETLSPAVPTAVEEAAEKLLRQCCDAQLTIATAESCTGGLLASLLTDIPGASHAFERGVVVYSEGSKCELLGVARDQIDTCGAVSREVAIAMAQGAINQSTADIALAITGYAGPTDDGGEDGLVHLACARRDGATFHTVEHFGAIGRGPVRIGAIASALKLMEEAIDGA